MVRRDPEYWNRHTDTAAGRDREGFAETLPWLVGFGLVLLLTNEVMWKVRDALHMRLEQQLAHALGRAH